METFSFVLMLTALLIDGSNGGNTPSSGNYHFLSEEEAREVTNNLADIAHRASHGNTDILTQIMSLILQRQSDRSRGSSTFHDDERVMAKLQNTLVRIGNQYCADHTKTDLRKLELNAKITFWVSKSQSHSNEWKGICEVNYKLKIGIPETDAECRVNSRKKRKVTFVNFPGESESPQVISCSCHVRDGAEEEMFVVETTPKNLIGGEVREKVYHHLRKISSGKYQVIGKWVAYSNVSQAIIYPDGFSRSSEILPGSAHNDLEHMQQALGGWNPFPNTTPTDIESREAEDLEQAIMNSLLEYTKHEAESSTSVGLSEESSSSERQDPDLTTGYRIDPLFPGDPLSIENYVHRNIKSVDDRWISGAEPADLPKICVKAFNMNVGDNGLKATCSSKESDGQIVYKQLENVPADTAKLLHCICKAKIGKKDIEDLFYLLEIGYSETAEHSTFHYIYLDSDNGGGVPQKCFIQFGWKITVKN